MHDIRECTVTFVEKGFALFTSTLYSCGILSPLCKLLQIQFQLLRSGVDAVGVILSGLLDRPFSLVSLFQLQQCLLYLLFCMFPSCLCMGQLFTQRSAVLGFMLLLLLCTALQIYCMVLCASNKILTLRCQVNLTLSIRSYGGLHLGTLLCQ